MPNLGPLDLFVPLIILLISILYLPVTLLRLLLNRDFTTLKSWPKFRKAWFARFFLFFGWASRPLFASDVEKVVSDAYGVVLDVGSGAGDWLYLFAPGRNKRINKVFLLEPNKGFHGALRRKAVETGLGARFEVLGEGAELEKKVGRAEVDTVVTVHVLCSVGDPEKVMKELYGYLKPGGQWLIYEHVKSEHSFAGIWQSLLDLFWPAFVDGCYLTRKTKETLMGVGKWEEVDLRGGTGEGSYSQVPHIVGRLVKAKT